MKKHLLFSTLLLTLAFLCSCGQSPAAPSDAPPPANSAQESLPPEAPPPPDSNERAAALVSELSTEEKVGQLIFARFPAADAAADAITYHLGGYVLFGRDFKDKTADEIIQTIHNVQKVVDIPLLMGVDEEGGSVVRASSNPHLRGQKFQSPQTLYAAGGLDAIRQDTEQKNVFLKALGLNVNLAPVADLSTSSGDFIYDRSFGQGAAETAQYVETVVGQMAADGMGSVLKHFPGYGNNVDTHTGISVDARALDQLKSQDALPFQAGWSAANGTAAVLVSHNLITSIDNSLPASLSPAVHKYLRQDLGFTGVAMTDDLIMDAIKAYANHGSAAVLAVQAGNDLLISSDYVGDYTAVLAAVEEGSISSQRLNEAVTRVMVWKMELGLL